MKDVLLLDVTPLDLGIETMGGKFTRLIEANTTIPKKNSEIFSTATDNQPSVEIHVLQGQRDLAKYNRTLGRFHLDGLPPARRGEPQIEVTFDIDANGILNVSAKDKATGKEQKIRIEASSGLSDDEIERMRNEAKANEANDKAEVEIIEKLNAADTMIFQTEKQLNEYGDKLTPANKEAIETALKSLRDAHIQKDTTAIESSMTNLTNAWNAASQDMYNASGDQATDNPNSSADNGANAENVTDVDFEEVDNKNK